MCMCVCVFTCIFDDSSRHILPANSSLQVNKHKHTSALCSVISTVLSFAFLGLQLSKQTTVQTTPGLKIILV